MNISKDDLVYVSRNLSADEAGDYAMVRIKVDEDLSPFLQINIYQGGELIMNASRIIGTNDLTHSRISMTTDSTKRVELQMKQPDLPEKTAPSN